MGCEVRLGRIEAVGREMRWPWLRPVRALPETSWRRYGGFTTASRLTAHGCDGDGEGGSDDNVPS